MTFIVKTLFLFLVIAFVLAPGVSYFLPGGNILVLALVVAAFVCLYERIERAVRRRSQMKR